MQANANGDLSCLRVGFRRARPALEFFQIIFLLHRFLLPSSSPSEQNHSARFSFAENDQHQSASGRISDPEKSVLLFAMLWVKEFHRTRVCPDGLSLFKPDPMFAIVHTENRVSDCFGIDEWKALARAARSTIRLRLKFSTRTLRFFRPIGLETILPTHSKNLQLKLIRRRARSDGAAHRLQETR
jgi:hypothetical protein